jgi:hypothetical protein
MNTDLRITYELVGTGWSRCTIRADGNEVELTASYLSNALGQLVLSAIAIITGFRQTSFSFDEEPGESRWVLETVDINVIELSVFEFEELWGNKPNRDGTQLLALSLRPITYARAVCAAAHAVLAEYGADGYKQKWSEHSFPERELEILVEAIAAIE